MNDCYSGGVLDPRIILKTVECSNYTFFIPIGNARRSFMKRIIARTVEGQTIDLSYDPNAAEGLRYAVNGQPACQYPRRAGDVWELWVPRNLPGPPYEIYRLSDEELQRLREVPDMPEAGATGVV
jgi:hypothetical protein